MRRRDLFTAGAVGASVIAAGSLLPPGRPLLGRWLIDLIPHDGRLHAAVYQHIAALSRVSLVGRALLDQDRRQSADQDADALEDWLIRRLAITDPASVDATAFAQALQSAIAEDFDNDRLIDADGWLVSQTEAHVAALRYRLHGAREPSQPPALRNGMIAEVSAWGPQSTEQGVPVNVQSDGHSGLWFQATGAPSWLKLEIDGTLASTQVFDDLVTSGLYDAVQERVLATPGRYELAFVDEMNRLRQPIGHFEVTRTPDRLLLDDRSRSRAFCPVIEWGPGELRLQQPENLQPDGNIGLWFKTACAAAQTRVLIDEQALASTVDLGQGVVTALLPPALLSAGRQFVISFHDPESGEQHRVGSLQVYD